MTTYPDRLASWLARYPGSCPRDFDCSGCLRCDRGSCDACQDAWDRRHVQPWLQQRPQRVSQNRNLAIRPSNPCRGDGGRSSTHPYGPQTAASGGAQ
jgi:hypothetical protein